MAAASATANSFANRSGSKTGTNSYQRGATNAAIIGKIKQIYNQQTVPVLASWLKLTLKTAKNRLLGEREFTLDEVAQLLHSQQGFEILTALMEIAPTKPQWWKVCEPLMEFASIKQMQAIVDQRVAQAIQEAANAKDVVTEELRRAQAMAIHDPEFFEPQINAVRSITSKTRRMVVPKRGP